MTDDLRDIIEWADTAKRTALNNFANVDAYIKYAYKDRLSMRSNKSILLDDEACDMSKLVEMISDELSCELGIKAKKMQIKVCVQALANANLKVEKEDLYSDNFKEELGETDANLKEIYETIDNDSERNEWDKYKKWRQDECAYTTDKNGNRTGVECTYSNLIGWLENFPYTKGKIRYNDTRSETSFGNDFMSDIHLHQIMQWISKYLCRDFSNLKALREACDGCAIKNRYDEAYDYWESLDIDNNDTTDYIDLTIREVLKCEDRDKYYDYYYKVIKMSLLANMKRVYLWRNEKKTAEFHDSMTLCSKTQGSGKTTFFKRLYDFNDNGRSLCLVVSGSEFRPSDKDFIIQTHKYLNVLLDEVDIRRGNVNTIKGYLSKSEDEFREPYAQYSRKRARLFIVTATSNNDDFLRDYTTTKERRWDPIPIAEDPTNARNINDWFDNKNLKDGIWTQIRRILRDEPDFPLYIDDERLNMQLTELQKRYKLYQTEDSYRILDDIINGQYCIYNEYNDINDLYSQETPMIRAKDIVDQYNHGDCVAWANFKNEQLQEKKKDPKFVPDVYDRPFKTIPEKLDKIPVSVVNDIISLMKIECTPKGVENHFEGTLEKKYISYKNKKFYAYVRI